MKKEIVAIVKNALREDVCRKDITTGILIPESLRVSAKIVAREKGIVCGMFVSESVFKLLDKGIKFKANFKDGARIKKGDILVKLSGKASAILKGERTALNFLGRLSGISTLTNEFVQKVKSYKVKIFDTRKTTPNLRTLEKYAVRCGKGFNHRFNLYEQVLIKDNHLSVIRCPLSVISLKDIVNRVRNNAGGRRVEIEVSTIKEFKEALQAKADIIMLDNFTLNNIKRAVSLRGRRRIPQLEASGGISLRNVAKIAACSVERISIGALTHSVKSLDISLEISKD